MGQVTIYLEDELELKMRNAADAAGMSKSKWIAKLIESCVDDEWPDSVRKLAGTWPDFPGADEMRRTIGDDVPREPL